MTEIAGRSPDFAIVGGGLVGAAVAWGLARAGQRVALLDEGDIAFRAARGNFGNVWVQGKGGSMPAYANLTRRAATAWTQFAAELEGETGIDLHFRRPGAFYLCFSQDDLKKRAAALADLEARAGIPSPVEVVDRDELARRVPAIGPDIAGATYCADDGTANPLHLLRALIAATVARGGSYLPRHKALAIRAGGGGFAIDTDAGTIPAGAVVLAAGLGNAELAPMLGLEAPVRPVRGQILVTEKLQPFLEYGTNFIRQTREGGCIFGESSEEAGLDESTTLPVLRETARRAVTAFPLLARARVVRSWGALRIMTPDGAPVYRSSQRYPGASVISVHSGVTLAPVHAGEIAATLVGGTLNVPAYQPFSPDRFHVQAA